MNVMQMIERVREGIRQKHMTGRQKNELSQQLNMELHEFARFQELKSLAFAEGRLSLEEANIIYGFLGETPLTFNAQPVEVKMVLTLVFKNLLDERIKKQ
jgi:hypothetical protein